jgi:membrane protein involved in D-alanine export
MSAFQPYANPRYFVILLVALLPLIIGLLRGRRHRNYETFVSLVFIVLIFAGGKWHEGVALIGYVLWQLLLVMGYARYRHKANSTGAYWGVILASIAPLVVVKITPVFAPQPSLLGFLGISYLTFKSVQTLLELRDGTLKQVDPLFFLRFLLFLPTISSGPIDRYRRFAKDYNNVPTRAHYLELLQSAVHKLFLGFAYKFVIGYFLGTLLLPKVAHIAIMHRHLTGGLGISWALVAYMYVYSLYLFFDFAGYSLFAVSLSQFMGIDTPQNFNQPFRAKNIKDFWNRWHMSLSFWFRDFIFMRVTFALMKKRVFKNRVHVAQTAYLINFLVMGFWHGVTWYYIVYGLFHAVAIIVNDMWLRYKKRHHLPHNRATTALAIFITFNVVCFSFLIFSGFLNTLWFK